MDTYDRRRTPAGRQQQNSQAFYAIYYRSSHPHALDATTVFRPFCEQAQSPPVQASSCMMRPLPPYFFRLP